MTDRAGGEHRREPEQPDPTSDAWSAWLPRLDRPEGTLPQASGPAPAADAAPPLPPPTLPPAPTLPPGSWRRTGPPSPAPPLPPPLQAQPTYAVSPPSRLLLAVLCTVLCFLPFGIVAIVRSVSVGPLWRRGRFGEAEAASRSVLAWCLAAALVWPVLPLLLVIAIFAL
ncbi:hypothetical protein GCM10023258_38160 [Terrabacter aeriphilus]|uniref:Interferon-induced transmembrane protein n=1 Tax=Terrabacter aeriphilus TaxID=515662 RepID=A0ABP9JLK4_9MICO